MTLKFAISETQLVIVEAMKRKPDQSIHEFLGLALQAGLQVLLQDAARDGLESSLAEAKPVTGTRAIHFYIKPELPPKLPDIGQRES